MKITIEPTTGEVPTQYTVSVSNNVDGNIEEAVELVMSALVAYGFQHDTVRDYFHEIRNNLP